MHTVELLEQALAAAEQVGFQIRQDWLGGEGGGSCLFRGQKMLMIDLAQSPAEQLADAVAALRGEPGVAHLTLPAELALYLGARRSA